MALKHEWKKLVLIAGVFLVFFYLPTGTARFDNAVLESFHLAKWYAREHVLLCLVPAFFIAGAIGVFVSQASVMKYLGAKANKVLAYGVASVSGTILAVCSCTVLPLFSGIYRMGAGLGPACSFLYSGPAINVLAIVLTARILGLELGIARALGAIIFSVVIGVLMHLIFRREEESKAAAQMMMPEEKVSRKLWQNALYFAAMVGVLVFANWGSPNDYTFELDDGTVFQAAVMSSPWEGGAADEYRVKRLDIDKELSIPASRVVAMKPVPGAWTTIWSNKWPITAVFGVLLGVTLVLWFSVEWWKVVATGGVVALLAFASPSGGLWVLLPFGAGVIGLSMIAASGNDEMQEWLGTSWTFAKQILPLLLFGVLVAGLLLGRVGYEGIIPSEWVHAAVGGNSLQSNFFASFAGAFMYFATLTEVPILQGLIDNGMGKGPALALLLAGPALSLPNMLVIRSVLGTMKTVVFVSLVIVMATFSGMIYGALF